MTPTEKEHEEDTRRESQWGHGLFEPTQNTAARNAGDQGHGLSNLGLPKLSHLILRSCSPDSHLRDKSHFALCISFLLCWIWFASLLWRDFAPIFFKDIGLFFSCGVFGFGVRVMLASQNEFGSVPSIF